MPSSNIPGAASLVFVKDRSTEWYCNKHKDFVWPLFMRAGLTIYPACKDCFILEVKKFDKAEKASVMDDIISEAVGHHDGDDVISV